MKILSTQVKFYKPKRVRTYAGLVFDKDGKGCDIRERGLAEPCEDTGLPHEWLLLPYEEGQKEYCVCMKCFTVSHL